MSDQEKLRIQRDIENIRIEIRDVIRKKFTGKALTDRINSRNAQIKNLEDQLKKFEPKETPEQEKLRIQREIENIRIEIRDVIRKKFTGKALTDRINSRNAQIKILEDQLKKFEPEETPEQAKIRIQREIEKIRTEIRDVIRKKFTGKALTDRINSRNAQIKILEDQLSNLSPATPPPPTPGNNPPPGDKPLDSNSVDPPTIPPCTSSVPPTIFPRQITDCKLTKPLYTIRRINCDTYSINTKCEINNTDCEVCTNFAYRDWYDTTNASSVKSFANHDDSKHEYSRTWVQTCNLGIGIFLLSVGIYYQSN